MGQSKQDSQWISGKSLYGLTLLISVISILLPAICLWANQNPDFNPDLFRFQFADRNRKYLYLFSAIFVLLQVSYKPCLKILERVSHWLNKPEYQSEKRKIFGFILVFIIAFFWKLHFGIINGGVPGWTYKHSKSLQIKSEKALPPINLKQNDIEFLLTAVNRENILKYGKEGYLSGTAQFLHFKSGEILPVNYGITHLSWPSHHFGFPGKFKNLQTYFSMISSSLSRRRQGRRFLLPESISYPSHITFYPIDYRNYPSADQLTTLSYWQFIVRLYKNGEIDFVKVQQLDRFEGSRLE